MPFDLSIPNFVGTLKAALIASTSVIAAHKSAVGIQVQCAVDPFLRTHTTNEIRFVWRHRREEDIGKFYMFIDDDKPRGTFGCTKFQQKISKCQTLEAVAFEAYQMMMMFVQWCWWWCNRWKKPIKRRVCKKQTPPTLDKLPIQQESHAWLISLKVEVRVALTVCV